MLGDPFGPPLTFSPHLSLFLSADTTTAAAHLEGSGGVEGAGRGFFLLHLEGKREKEEDGDWAKTRRRSMDGGVRRWLHNRLGREREMRGQGEREASGCGWSNQEKE